MNNIEAKYTDKTPERADGLTNKECPLCGEVVLELDMEEYYEEGTERCVECCTDCREDFEQESGLKLDSDTPTKDVFVQLAAYAEPLAKKRETAVAGGLTDANADAIAIALGGEAWQSGGGIMLILFRRPDGRLVVLSDECVCEYASEEAFEQNSADTCIRLRSVTP